jgi:hypothetical protein
MNERIIELAEHANYLATEKEFPYDEDWFYLYNQLYAKLIVKDCIAKIETYRIPVGNSAAGEIACELTYASLREIRDDIKELFGVSNE